jgi:Spy/CpxP family protein refolding chaperone
MTSRAFSRLVATILALSGFAFAVGVHGRGQRPQGPGGPGFGRGGPGPGGFARLAELSANLSDEQRTQVQAILEEDRASRKGAPEAMTLHRQLEAEILADSPDEQKIDGLRQQLVQAQGAALERQIALQRRIAQILTPEQRAKARERLADGPRRRG